MFIKSADQTMDDIVSSPPSPSRKRAAPDDNDPSEKLLNLKGNQFMVPTPPDTDNSNNNSPEDHKTSARAASPAPSSSALSTIESVSAGVADSNTILVAPQGTADTGIPTAKRRKLTPAEKAEQQQLREAKERDRVANKLRKDEERRVKDEEKRLRDEEKRKKAEERDAKKREKEVEEERKAQEKLKKERSQMRLGAFFQAKPATSPGKTQDGEEVEVGRARRKSLSLEPFDAVADQIKCSASPSKGVKLDTPKRALERTPSSIKKPTVQSDYRRTFLPFQLPSHTQLAPPLQPRRTEEELQIAQAIFDGEVTDPSLREKYDLGISDSYAGISQYFAADRRTPRGLPITSVRELIDKIQGTSTQPIDLTEDLRSTDHMAQLQRISLRHIHFYEDVRPSYFGTYSKVMSPRQIRKLCTNPFSRTRTDTDYDYDSEAEWEEPEEGEDLLSDDEEEIDDPADAEDMEAFLDDADDTLKNKRKIITGDLVPTSTGVCWEDGSGRMVSNDQAVNPTPEWYSMGLDILLPNFQGKTIDPFSTEYWNVEPSPATQVGIPKGTTTLLSAMAPPRPPLQQRSNTNSSLEHNLIGAAEGERGPITSVAAVKRGRKPAPKHLSTEDLEEFKEAVVGSPLGKIDLLKGLKSRFPKITHEAIKDTLGSQFAQVGISRAEKKWVFVG